MDAREPDARHPKGRSAHCARQEKWKRAVGSERRTRRYCSAGNRTDGSARRFPTSSDGWIELHWVGKRLVTVAEKSGESKASRYDGKRDNGFSIPNGGLGPAGGQRSQAAVEGKSGGSRTGARSGARNRDTIRHAALHDVTLTKIES